MRQRNWIPAVLVVTLLLPARDAGAFWEYIRELSGPGGFVGLSLLLPFSLSHPPTLTRTLNNENLENLRRLGVDAEFLTSTAEEYFANRGHQRLLEKEFGVYLPDRQHCPEASEDARRLPACLFLKATQIDPTYPSRLVELLAPFPAQEEKFKSTPSPDEWTKVAADRLEVLDGMLLEIQTRELRKRLRHYDADMGGLFGGFRRIPAILDTNSEGRVTNRINNWFITPSLGAAYALHNNIPYADGLPGGDVLWLSAYLALEKRFLALGDGKANLFFQVGPAVHYFTGLQFEDFWKGSVRGRLGVQFRMFYLGGQLDYFLTPIKNEQFGALPDPDPERWSGGFFVGISLNRTRR